MDRQVRVPEAGQHVFGQIARQPLARGPFVAREGNPRRRSDFAAGGVGSSTLAVVVRDADQSRNVDHCASQRRVQRVRVNRDEDHLAGVDSRLSTLVVDPVRQVPAEVRCHPGVVDPVGRIRQHGVASGLRQHVGVGDPERRALAGRRHDGGRGTAFQHLLRPQHDVVDVVALPQAAYRSTDVPATVAGVEHHGHAVEVQRQNLVLDLLSGGALRLPLHAARMVRRQVARREQVDGDSDLVADRQVPDVADPVALLDLPHQLVHVAGEETAGESHDDARVEGLARLQPVARVLAFLVRSVAGEGCRFGPGGDGRRSGRRRGQHAGKGFSEEAARDEDCLAGTDHVAGQAVRLPQHPVVLAGAREPLGDAPQALRIAAAPGRRHPVLPAVGYRLVLRQQGTNRHLLACLRQQIEGNPVADTALQAPYAAVGAAERRGVPRVAAESLREGEQAFVGARLRLDVDSAVSGHHGDRRRRTDLGYRDPLRRPCPRRWQDKGESRGADDRRADLHGIASGLHSKPMVSSTALAARRAIASAKGGARI